MAAAKVLGIPHPPGNPLFVLIAYLFGTLPIAADYAVRLNLLAPTTSAASAGIWFLVANEVTRRLFQTRWAQLTAAAVCTLIGATSFTVWNRSVVNERGYTVSMLQLAVVVWLAMRWTRQPAGKSADRLLLRPGTSHAISCSCCESCATSCRRGRCSSRTPRTRARWGSSRTC